MNEHLLLNECDVYIMVKNLQNGLVGDWNSKHRH